MFDLDNFFKGFNMANFLLEHKNIEEIDEKL